MVKKLKHLFLDLSQEPRRTHRVVHMIVTFRVVFTFLYIINIYVVLDTAYQYNLSFAKYIPHSVSLINICCIYIYT